MLRVLVLRMLLLSLLLLLLLLLLQDVPHDCFASARLPLDIGQNSHLLLLLMQD